MYMEFVSRRDAAFLKCTKIRGVLRAYFTFSTYVEFVKWAKKKPAEAGKGHQFLDLCQKSGLNMARTVKISRRLKNMKPQAQNLLKLGRRE